MLDALPLILQAIYVYIFIFFRRTHVKLLLGLLGCVADGECGTVGVLQDDGDDAVGGVEVGYLVVVLQHGTVGPGAEFLLQTVAQLLPQVAGAVIGAQAIVLLYGLQLLVVEGDEHTVLLSRIGKDNGTAAVGGGRVDGKATILQALRGLFC